MAKNSSLDFAGIGDARPLSSTTADKGQGGHRPVSAGDYRGLEDSRPSSNPNDCQHVNVGSGEKSSKKSGGPY